KVRAPASAFATRFRSFGSIVGLASRGVERGALSVERKAPRNSPVPIPDAPSFSSSYLPDTRHRRVFTRAAATDGDRGAARHARRSWILDQRRGTAARSVHIC